MVQRHLLLIAIAVLLAGCTPSISPRSCDEITGKGLRELMQQSIAPEEMQKRIATAYGLSLEQVFLGSGSHIADIYWSKDGIDGMMQIDGIHPLVTGLHYSQRPPLAETVIACLGTPEYYSANYQGPSPETTNNVFAFDTYFVRQGIGAGVIQHLPGKTPPRLDNSIPLTDFEFVPVGSTEETMERLNRNLSEKLREQIKPWPGNWHDLTVMINSDFPPQ